MEVLEGVYYDPKHGGCVRTIAPMVQHDSMYVVHGAYGDDEASPPGREWHAHLRCVGLFLTVDFVGKKTSHARVYHALWCPSVREIHWQDGNVWKKLYSVA